MTPTLLLVAFWLAVALLLGLLNRSTSRQPAKAITYYGMCVAFGFAVYMLLLATRDMA